jgi:hypothetical protein
VGNAPNLQRARATAPTGAPARGRDRPAACAPLRCAVPPGHSHGTQGSRRGRGQRGARRCGHRRGLSGRVRRPCVHTLCVVALTPGEMGGARARTCWRARACSHTTCRHGLSAARRSTSRGACRSSSRLSLVRIAHRTPMPLLMRPSEQEPSTCPCHLVLTEGHCRARAHPAAYALG